MATHSSVLAWRIPGTGKPGWAAVCGVAQSQTRLKQLSSSSSSSNVLALTFGLDEVVFLSSLFPVIVKLGIMGSLPAYDITKLKHSSSGCPGSLICPMCSCF